MDKRLNFMNSKGNRLVHWLFGPYTSYIQRLLPIFQLCVLLFTFSLSMGYILGHNISQSALEQILGGFPDVSGMSYFEVFGFIIANNALKSLLFMLAGLLAGVPPLLFVIFNGFFIGWFAYSLSSTSGLGFVALGLIPHGIFEIPAILFSMAMGTSIGYEVVNRLRGKGNIGVEVRIALSFFINRIFLFLLLAAIIEVTITPLLLISMGFV